MTNLQISENHSSSIPTYKAIVPLCTYNFIYRNRVFIVTCTFSFELPWLNCHDYIFFLTGEFIVINKIKRLSSFIYVILVNRENTAIMALRAHDPYRNPWSLQVLTNIEIAERLEKGEEANIWSFIYPLKHKVVSQVFVSIMDIGSSLTNKHNVNNFLWSVPMIIE